MAFIAVPIVRDLPPPAGDATDPRQRLAEDRQRLLADLYDLELAFHSGRLSHRDYDRLRAEVGSELSAVLDAIDASEAVPAEPAAAS